MSLGGPKEKNFGKNELKFMQKKIGFDLSLRPPIGPRGLQSMQKRIQIERRRALVKKLNLPLELWRRINKGI